MSIFLSFTLGLSPNAFAKEDRPDHYNAQPAGWLDTGVAEFAGLDDCGQKKYGFAHKDLTADDVYSLRCGLGGTITGTMPKGTFEIESVAHQLIFQDLAFRSHQTSICQQAFFDSYLKRPDFSKKLDDSVLAAYHKIKLPLQKAIVAKERYDYLRTTDNNVYNGSDADHREMVALDQQQDKIESALTLLPKSIPIGNNPLVEEMILNAAKTGASDSEVLKNFRQIASTLKAQAATSVANYSSPSMKAKDGSYKVTRDMEIAFAQSGALQSMIENSDASPRSKNIALCQTQKIYGTGATVVDVGSKIVTIAGLTALTYLAPPIGVELASASAVARSAYAARALMLASRSVHYVIQGATFLSSLPAIQKKCFDPAFLTSSQKTCDANSSFDSVLKESNAADCAATIALSASAFMTEASAVTVAERAVPTVSENVGTAARIEERTVRVPTAEGRKIPVPPKQDRAFRLPRARRTAPAPAVKTPLVVDQPGVLADLAPHPSDTAQLRIWQLAESGKAVEAAELRASLGHQLEGSPIKSMQRLKETDPTAGDPYLVTLEDGTRGIWKASAPLAQNADAEVAAYAIDQQLGLNMVPVTVRRMIDGKNGSIQLFVGNAKTGLMHDPGEFGLLDTLIANSDRRGANYLVVEGRKVAIDNGFGYLQTVKPATNISDKILEARISYSTETMKAAVNPNAKNLQALAQAEDKARERISSVLGTKSPYDKLRSTTPEQWEAILHGKLGPDSLEKFLRRRQWIIDQVEPARRELGEGVFSH